MTNVKRLEKLAERSGLKDPYIHTDGKGRGFALYGHGAWINPVTNQLEEGNNHFVGYYPSLDIALEKIPAAVKRFNENSAKVLALRANS